MLRSLSWQFAARTALVRRREASTLTKDVAGLVEKYTLKKPTSASLQILMRTGRGELLDKTYDPDAMRQLDHQQATERILMQVASFVRREIPIRLAYRIQDLDSVPMLCDMPSVRAVKQIYVDSFLELIDVPKITTVDEEEAFAKKLEGLYEKHSNVLIQMARGAYELREQVRAGNVPGAVAHYNLADSSMDFERMDECHDALDRFYMSRIGIRVLAGQYIALRGEPLENYVGLICSDTSPLQIVQYAANDATRMCERDYGHAPNVIINGRLDLTFPYVPTHLHYILLELLKNAMRATMDKHGMKDYVPDVVVIIADGQENEDVVIKVADEGGGIPRSQIHKIWSYLFTTADPSKQEAFFANSDHSPDSPLAGLGYGLPISRSYVRYFGGDLDIMSMEGFGTDAFVFLRRLGDSREPLPV